MVVPHCGSKTINVRLTVSPDAKSKSGDFVKKTIKNQHLRSRRLFKCDDDEEGSGSGGVENNQEHTRPTQFPDDAMQPTYLVENQSISDVIAENDKSKDTIDGHLTPCCNPNDAIMNDSTQLQRQSKSNQTTEMVHEGAQMENVTSISKSKCDKVNNNACCRDCRVTSQPYQTDGILNSKPCVRRIIRKSRSRKPKPNDLHPAARIRSLSVGNENSYRNSNGDASSGASGKDRNDECLNNLRRNDLIDIIRESMEKSRLCFQSNGYVE